MRTYRAGYEWRGLGRVGVDIEEQRRVVLTAVARADNGVAADLALVLPHRRREVRLEATAPRRRDPRAAVEEHQLVHCLVTAAIEQADQRAAVDHARPGHLAAQLRDVPPLEPRAA